VIKDYLSRRTSNCLAVVCQRRTEEEFFDAHLRVFSTF
jgi:hypothetical protein